jgi:hypothetical protein
MSVSRVQDKKPYIEVKDAIVARSGMYTYTREEILARGHKPAQVKDFYIEYRPPAVIVAASPLFDLVIVPNKEHSDEEITSDNFRTHASGIVGGPITAVAMPDGIDIGLKGRIAFFTKDAYDYYMAGNKETSADYVSESALVDNPEKVGYDLIVTKILSVNNVAITKRGRGGKEVRIQDSAPATNAIDEILGRSNMGILSSLFGLDQKPEKSFSASVKDSLIKAKTMTAEDRMKEVEAVMSFVTPFTDSNMKSALIGVVRDSFVHVDKVLDKWKESETIIDGLYARCVDSDAAIAHDVQDSGSDEEKEKADAAKKKKDEDDEKEKTSREKDTATMVDEKIASLRKDLPDMITESIKKALGTGGAESEGSKLGGSRVTDSAAEVNTDFVVSDAFGRSSGF